MGRALDLSLSANLANLSTADFCWTWYESARGVQEFNKSGRQHALANKPPAGHLTMADTDKDQMA